MLYFPPVNGEWERVIEDVASVQKSVSALLVGIAQHQGLLRLEDPVGKHLGAGWSKASPEQEQAITVRHLLTMTSGLMDDLTFEAAAGTRWRYNSAAYAHIVNGQSEVARGAGQKVKDPLIPTAAPDLVAALGAVDRKLYVVPSLELVVTRLGNSAGPAFQNDFWKLLSDAAPKH